jgi:hypothetical protein
MGYLSTYNLNVEGEGTSELIAQLRAENENAQFALDDDGNSMDMVKWYESDEDLVAFSAKHPHALFILEMQGEEGERACVFAKGGRSYREESGMWTPDKFDESKLLAPGQLPSEAPKPYTVVLLYPEGTGLPNVVGQTYTTQQFSAGYPGAVNKARVQMHEEEGWEPGTHEPVVVGLFPGHHYNEATEYMDIEHPANA